MSHRRRVVGRVVGPVVAGLCGMFCVLGAVSARAQAAQPPAAIGTTAPPAGGEKHADVQREPVYDPDPFGDADLAKAPLILNTAHPTKNRVDFALGFAATLVDKYVQQAGATMDLRYHFGEHWGVGATLSFFGGSLTDIVTGGAGVLGNKVTACRTVNATSCDLTLHVPDTKQMTGSFDVTAVWLPLYGKVNLVSELDFDMQLYLLAGGGVNGTRSITASYDPSSRAGYSLSGGGFGEGGMFAGALAHLTMGAGLSIFLTNWLALRSELRTITWHESLDGDGDGVATGYTSWRFVGAVSLAVVH